MRKRPQIPVMKSMTPDEVWTFLTEQARTAQCATVKENGHPHVVPVWFDVDGKTLVFSTWQASVKAANCGVTRESACALTMKRHRLHLSDRRHGQPER